MFDINMMLAWDDYLIPRRITNRISTSAVVFYGKLSLALDIVLIFNFAHLRSELLFNQIATSLPDPPESNARIIPHNTKRLAFHRKEPSPMTSPYVCPTLEKKMEPKKTILFKSLIYYSFCTIIVFWIRFHFYICCFHFKF